MAKLLESNLADSMEMMNISGSPSTPSTRAPNGHASNHPTFPASKQPATPSSALLLPARLTCTSTPATASHLASKQDSRETSNKFTFSPPGRKPTPVILSKASDVFDISDSFMVMDIDTSEIKRSGCNQSRADWVKNLSASEKQEKMSEDGEDSFDRFDLATQETPFAERVKKRMNQ